MWKKKNTEAIVQISILSGIAILLAYGMISKKMNYYVHPRFNAGILVTIVILFLFSISLIPNIKRARHNANINHYIIFVIPILVALIFSSSAGNSINRGNNNISTALNIGSNEVPSKELADSNTDTIDNEDLSEKSDSSTNYDGTDSLSDDNVSNNTVDNADEDAMGSDISEKYAQYEVDGITVINDDVFQDWNADIYDNLDCFVGKKYQYLAQVFSMDDFEGNQFLAGRYFMVCCAADLAVYGIICESDARSGLKEEQWITVTGTIKKYEYNDTVIPMLTDVTITEAEAPASEYIYYNYD